MWNLTFLVKIIPIIQVISRKFALSDNHYHHKCTLHPIPLNIIPFCSLNNVVMYTFRLAITNSAIEPLRIVPRPDQTLQHVVSCSIHPEWFLLYRNIFPIFLLNNRTYNSWHYFESFWVFNFLTNSSFLAPLLQLSFQQGCISPFDCDYSPNSCLWLKGIWSNNFGIIMKTGI